MRLVLALLALAAGITALGLWAAMVTTVLIERDLRLRAEALIDQSTLPLSLKVSGRDMTVSGALEDAAQGALVLAQLRQLAGLRRLRAEVALLPLATPYRLRLEKAAPEALLMAQGHLPKAALLPELGLSGQKITLARGAPPDWAARVKAAMAAVALLDQGFAVLEDQHLLLVGACHSAETERLLRAVLADFPLADLRLNLAEDGRPPLWWLRMDAETGVEIGGKLPLGSSPAQIAAWLGLADLRGSPAVSQHFPADLRALAELAPWLGQIERLSLHWSPQTPRALAEVQGGVEKTALAQALHRAGFTPDIREITPKGRLLSQRIHAASKRRQILLGPYWLDLPEVLRTPQGCQRAVDAAWRGRRLGQGGQEGADVALLNDLARHIQPCAALPALRADILYPQADLARAESLREELRRRGVRAEALALRAYGKSAASAGIMAGESLPERSDLSILWQN